MRRGPNESVFRYVVNSHAGDKYFVRNGVQLQNANGTTSSWELYRVPIRTPDATIGTPNLRLIQHLRVTVAAPADPGLPDIVGQLCLCSHAPGRFALGSSGGGAYRRHFGLRPLSPAGR